MDDGYLERMNRQLALLGTEAQRIILGMVLLTIGCGGNGSLVAVVAALLGFRKLRFVDRDVLELSNLNRSLLWRGGASGNIDRPKAEIAAETASDLDPQIDARAIVDWIGSKEGLDALLRCDAAIVCVDQDEPRLLVNRTCADLGKPVLDIATGGVIREGEVRTLGWRASLFRVGGACLECIFLDAEPTPRTQISYVPLNLGAVSAGMDMLITCLTAYRRPRANHVVYDALTGRLEEMMISSRDDCPYCGKGERQ